MATKWGVLSTGKIAHDFVSVVNLLPKTDHQVTIAYSLVVLTIIM